MKTCSLCGRADLAGIDEGLIRGVPFRTLATQYGTSTGALQRHKRHISGKAVEDHQRAERARVRDLRGEVRLLLERALRLLDRAEDGQDVRAAAAAMHQVRETLKVALQVDGQLGGGAQVVTMTQVTVQADRERALALLAAEINTWPEPLHSMAIAHLREKRRTILATETERARALADSREPAPVFLDAPSENGQRDVPLLPGAGQGTLTTRPDGDDEMLRLAAECNWPTLVLSSRRRIIGEAGWRGSALNGTQADLAEAMQALTSASRGPQDASAPQSSGT